MLINSFIYLLGSAGERSDQQVMPLLRWWPAIYRSYIFDRYGSAGIVNSH